MTPEERQARAEQIEADRIAEELARHEKATRVAEGLMAKKARTEAKKRGKG